MTRYKIVAYLSTGAIWAYYTDHDMVEKMYRIKGDVIFPAKGEVYSGIRRRQADWRLL